MKILYVAHGDYWGSTWPYAFIDQYIIRSLKKMGHDVKVYDIFARADILKNFILKVAKEQNFSQDQTLAILDDRASADLPLEVINYEPDLVLHIVGRLGERCLQALKKLKVKTAIWFLDDPQEILKTSKMGLLYDHVYTVESQCVEAHRRAGSKSAEFLPLGCDPEVQRTFPVEDKYQSDICFIGVCFPRRLQFFDELADFLQKYSVKIIGGGKNIGAPGDPWLWKKKLKRADVLEKFIIDEIVFPEEAAKYFNGAKINLNIHRAAQDDRFRGAHDIMPTSVSGRTFEIAGCGAFQLIDDLRQDYKIHFKAGAEIVSFTDQKDFMEKVKHFLSAENERKQIAAAAQHRAYADHTYEQRLKVILEKCQ
ncbi:MAG: glycosyltransferase [Candidatus Margulisbacteria bacterium]|nr:glycosyltransferase [Candidatus Margulisiibacteriota bacterium]